MSSKLIVVAAAGNAMIISSHVAKRRGVVLTLWALGLLSPVGRCSTGFRQKSLFTSDAPIFIEISSFDLLGVVLLLICVKTERSCQKNLRYSR
jgi:hypothetical protein